MASTGSVPSPMGNGSPFNGRQQQTPADMVGNQFVSQFYTVLHSSPRYLHRFYTDESTVTHADFGLDGEAPRSTTVSTQKGISERVMAMGFEEAVTEIWSVDSQYSQNNGVMVMVTGSLQCKGKKKRDFVQSFFLAVQEKGYFVLNDTFRYLSDRSSSRPSQYPKENGYLQPDYKGYGQMAGYHPGHAYYPNHLPVQNSNMYAVHTTPSTYPIPEAIPAASGPLQQRSEAPRAQPITPSMPAQRLNAPNPTAPKAPVGSPAAPTHLPQPPQPLSAAPPAPAQQAAVVHTAPPPPTLPTAAAPPTTAAAPPQPTPAPPQEASKAKEPAAQPQAAPKAEAAPTPAEAAPTPQPPIAKPEAVESKPEQAPPKPTEPPSEPAEPAAPAAPLTYAERLKLGSKQGNAKPTQPKPSSAPPKQTQQHARPAPQTPPVAESNGPPETPTATQPAGDVGPPIEDAVVTSIFVRDLPEGITSEKLEAAFSRFGAIKGGLAGIQLKQQKGKEDFAFVEFEEAAAMLAAVEGQVVIDGKTPGVTERRPMFPRNLRGTGYQRRDGGGRDGGGRGFRGGPGRDNRGRSRGDGRPFGGRGEGRGDGFGGRDGGRGRYGGGFQGDGRGDGRGDGGRGREGGRNRGRGEGRGPRAPQSAPPNRPQQAV